MNLEIQNFIKKENNNVPNPNKNKEDLIDQTQGEESK